ncbi:MAG: penicillin-binding protein 2 [Solirubrobacteraceae bacterium]|jgi:cell division protein FtsI/penicillin-binding protein 2
MALSQRRIRLLFLGFVALLAIGALRALDLGTLRASALSAQANLQTVRDVPVLAARGAILDRNGQALALTEPADDIEAWTPQITNPYRDAVELAPLLATSVATLTAELSRHATNVILARQLPAATAQRIAKLNINGVSLKADDIRDYPWGTVAAQVLGGVHSNGSGAGGVEFEYNRQLAGHDGYSRVVSAANGTPIGVSDPRTARPGETVQLTIDAQLQQEVESVLAGVGQQYQPVSATAILLVPSTGAVLALANWPAVNANRVGTDYAWEDHAIELNYEPGSTFKIVAVGGALSDGLITPSTPFYIPSQLTFDTRTINDSTPHPDETLTTTGIVAQSSNIGAVEIGQKLGTDQFADWVRRFGFGAPTGINLPGENEGLVPSLSQYNNFSMGNLPFGQGESVTPMQMATAYAAIANGGILRPPHVVSSIGGVAQPEPRGKRILSPAVASEMRTILEAVLQPGGTASEISIPGYTLAGKTGTANIAIPGGYSDTRYVASFIGFAPAQDPKIELAVIVDQPSDGAIYGTDAPAHAWQTIMEWALRYLKIPPG